MLLYWQITLGRFLRWLTDQQLDRVAIAAKNLVHMKWEKFRFPNGRNVTKSVAPTSKKPQLLANAPVQKSQSSSQEAQDKTTAPLKSEL